VLPVEYTSLAPGSHNGVLPEHYGRWMDPFVALMVIACSTRRIVLGTGLCLPAQRNPVALAKTVASLDVLSGGRLVLGVGAGWLREECEATGVPYAHRWKRLRESVEAMRALWTQEAAEYHGELIDFAPVRCEPKPIQAGGPRVLLGAGGTKLGGNIRALDQVARTYDGGSQSRVNRQTWHVRSASCAAKLPSRVARRIRSW
jgi:alkanesulfonate monooxygenase SsuD/methylene tetrahydromethanopterin reductase-like flavin-dependent oxidoreductase (luciferase family)